MSTLDIKDVSHPSQRGFFRIKALPGAVSCQHKEPTHGSSWPEPLERPCSCPLIMIILILQVENQNPKVEPHGG